MYPTFFQILLWGSVIIVIYRIWQLYRQHMLHLLGAIVLTLAGIGIMIGGGYINSLNTISEQIFGVERGADSIVYITIIGIVLIGMHMIAQQHKYHYIIRTLVTKEALRTARIDDMQSSNRPIFLIPVYNEDPVIVTEVIDHIYAAGYTIVLIDDGSAIPVDHTVSFPPDRFVFLRHDHNIGVGSAINTGISYIRNQSWNPSAIVTFDGDGQHQVADAERMIEMIHTHSDIDIVLGSRFLSSGSSMPRHRRSILHIGKLFTRLINGIYMTDTHNGLRCLHPRTLPYIHFTSRHMGYASELVDIIKKNNLKTCEIPVTIQYTKYSLHKGQKSHHAFSLGLAILYKKLFLEK